ncbi:YolD-like family protein [Virgibacillus siamensis]|uniref:YolD-like family protein n=1 Tax=Virgibacillus siamensis TaxID=480071 RepID=UPI000986ECF9|nr:YolD-like family protein [Virgibacillus siamensis]
MQDRGTIKWTASTMMMPEQTAMLKKYFAETEHKEKPILDEQQLADINMKLQCALHNDLTVKVKHFKNHDYYHVKGKLKMINSKRCTLQLNDADHTEIAFENLLDVTVL